MSNLKISQNFHRFWKISLGVLLIGFMCTTYALGAEVLFVVGKNNLKGTDLTIKKILKKNGHAVTVAKCDAVKPDNARGKDLVIISDSVLALHVNSKFQDSQVPVICLDPWLLDDLGMTAEVKLKNFGRKRRQQNIKIINPDHPLAASYSGKVQVSSESFYMGWGVPGEKAIKIATLESDPNKCPIFGYETGSEMPGGVAPARRAGFFLSQKAGESITPEGWFLFNAAVNWATSTPDAVAKAK